MRLQRPFPARTRNATIAGVLGTVGALVTTLAPAPAAADARAAEADEVLTVAHRGARYVAPENTLASIRAAVARGVDFVEVDVQRAKDGRLVLMHDSDLARTTDVERVYPRKRSYDVSAFTYRQMKRLDAGRWKGARFAGERIPTLKQALRLVQGARTGILIEMKSPERNLGVADKLSSTLRAVDGFIGRAVRRERLVVQSFDLAVAQTFKSIEPRVPVAVLGTPPVEQLPELAVWADEISSRHRTVDAAYVAAVHSFGMDASVWTVDTADNINANLDKGVDAVITDRPQMLDRVLRQRAAAS